MKSSTKKATVRFIVHFLGEGECNEMMNKEVLVPVEHLEPDIFVSKYLKEEMKFRDTAYRYHDCIYEKIELDGEIQRTMFVRYCLDTEKENFKSFLNGLKPGDFASGKSLQDGHMEDEI